MRILGIDPGGKAGFCHGEPGGPPAYSQFNVPEVDDEGVSFAAFRDHLTKLCIGNGITHCFYEGPFIDRNFINAKQIERGYGYRSFICEVTSRCKIKRTEITNAQWRSAIFDKGRPPYREDLTPTQRTAANRAWWKQRAIEYCVRKGWQIESDDIAEAVCIWQFGCMKVDVNVAVATAPLFALASHL